MSKKIMFFAAVFLFSAAANAEAPKLLRVTPSGKEVSELSQIVFQFDKPMTALGDMDAAAGDIPVEISPKANCSWRWMNTQALACRLKEEDKLALATRYEVTVRPGFKALDGSVTDKGGVYTIETRRPEINPKSVYAVSRAMKAPERPVWRVTFQVPATVQSIGEHLYFKANGKKIKANVSRESGWFSPTYTIEASEDMGRGVPYEIVYEAGFEADGAGPLKSERSGVLTKAQTAPVFGVQGLRCYDKSYATVTMPAAETLKNPPACRFGSPVYIVLTDRSVSEYQTENGVRKIDSFVRISPSAAIGEYLEGSDDLIRLSGMREGRVYEATVSAGVTDRWGAELPSDVRVAFKIADRDPNLETPDSSAVLEFAQDTDLIGYAANLDKAEIEYEGFSSSGNFAGTRAIAEISPALRNVQYPFNAGVRDMMNGKSGYLKGTYRTEPKLDWQSSFGVSVSPWQVTAKFGHFNSLVWVVDFQTGKPVEGASVKVLRLKDGNETHLGAAQTLAVARTNGDGTASFGGYASFEGGFKNFGSWQNATEYMLIVERDADMAVLPLTNPFSLWAPSYASESFPAAFNVSPDMHLRAWGVTAQGVYRQGDLVQYKIYVRNEDLFSYAPAVTGNYKISIVDPTDKTVYEYDAQPSEFGAFDGEFKLPASAVSGWYDVLVKYNSETLRPMRFLVSDFTPSAFKVSTELDKKKLTAEDTVVWDTSAVLFSGGAYAGAPVRRTAVLSYEPFTFKNKNFDANAFSFSKRMENWQLADETLLNDETKLDEKGTLRTELKAPSSPKPHGRIRFESSVSDDSGRKTSSSSGAEYFNADYFVGLRMSDWTATVGKPATIGYVVSNKDSETVADVPVSLTFSIRKNTYVREHTGGNAYVARYVSENQEAGACQGVSSAKEETCEFTPAEAGLYTVKAVVRDKNGREHESELSFYAQGKDRVIWESDESGRLSLSPEKETYKAGDTLNILVKNPVPGATALITAERYGILYSSVETLKDSTAMISIPVTQDFFPGVYVSVSLFSERVEKPLENGVDLGKPAEWTGYVKIPVEDDSKKITVGVLADKEAYRPRGKAKINVKASLPAGRKDKTQAAVVVLDEAVLALLPQGAKAYNPYDGFYTAGALDVKTYSLISRLIGRRAVEKKGANQGGDGGSDFAVRDLFKFVGYWNPALDLDENGEGSFEMDLPDNLTGWRVLVMVVSQSDLMGAGETRFEVNQPLEIRPLLPNQVRTTDLFSPAVSVLNRSKDKQTVSVSMKVSGAVKNKVEAQRKIRLKPSERRAVFFEGTEAFLPPQTQRGEITLTFEAVSGSEKDALSVKVPVLNLTAMQTAAQYGSSEQNVSVPLLVPDSVGVFGGVLELSASATALGGTEKVVEYMRDYPYSCWEQKISRALSAAVYLKLKKSISDKELWENADGLIKEVLEQAAGYQAPNGGMAYYQGKNEYVSPYLSAYTGYVFTRLAQAGYEADPNVSEKLKTYLYSLFRNTPEGWDSQTLRTVRLLSMPFLASAEERLIVPCDFDIMMRDLTAMTTFEKALLLQAAGANPDYAKIAAKIKDSLNASINVESGTALFQDAPASFLSALLSSPARNNCAVLSALTAGGKPADDADIAEKLFKGVQSLRRKDGTWGNTQANAFCLAAAADYAEAFEAEPVSMKVRGSFGKELLLSGRFDGRTSSPAEGTKVLTAEDAGSRTAEFEKDGAGRYYYKTVLSYPAAGGEPVLSGMEVRRSYAVMRDGGFVPVTQDTILERGDLVRVTLNVSNPAPRTFVVLSDPVPGALEPVNKDLATASVFDAEQAESSSGSFWSGFYFREIGHSAVNFYAEKLEKGEYELSYAAQVVADGTFNAFPAKAEAMYDPDIFGLGAASSLTVGSVETAAQIPEEEQEAEDFLPGAIVTGAEASGETNGTFFNKTDDVADPSNVGHEETAAADGDENLLPEREAPFSFLSRFLKKIGFGGGK